MPYCRIIQLSMIIGKSKVMPLPVLHFYNIVNKIPVSSSKPPSLNRYLTAKRNLKK